MRSFLDTAGRQWWVVTAQDFSGPNGAADRSPSVIGGETVVVFGSESLVEWRSGSLRRTRDPASDDDLCMALEPAAHVSDRQHAFPKHGSE